MLISAPLPWRARPGLLAALAVLIVHLLLLWTVTRAWPTSAPRSMATASPAPEAWLRLIRPAPRPLPATPPTPPTHEARPPPAAKRVAAAARPIRPAARPPTAVTAGAPAPVSEATAITIAPPPEPPASRPPPAAISPPPLRLALPRALPGSAPPASLATQDPRVQRPQSGGERFAEQLGTDQRTRTQALADGGRLVRRGADCVRVQPARESQINPFDPQSRNLPAQVGNC